MIVAAVKLRGRKEKRREIMQTMQGIADQVRKSEGCIGARCYQDISDRDVFYHVQEWQTRQHLDDHLNSSLFSALMGIKSILAEAPLVEFMFRGTE